MTSSEDGALGSEIALGSDRARALDALRAIERRGAFANLVLDESSGDARDDGFVRTLVFAVLRWRSVLDHGIERFAKRELESIDPVVLELLRIGLGQLWYMRVPPHAAVSETVSLTGSLAPRARGFVNAVLRQATRTKLDDIMPRGNSSASIAVRHGHPEWLIRRWILAFGVDRTLAIARADQELSYPDLVVNTRRTSVRDVLDELARRGMQAEESRLIDGVVRLHQSTAEIDDLLVSGHVYPMDEGSVIVARLIGGSEKNVLDFAAAPGGKTIVMRLGGANVVGHDSSFRRLALLRQTTGRIFDDRGLVVAGDATRPAFRKRFDAVLVDAPCSATGTIRRNPELKWRLREDDISGFAVRQKSMLAAALDLTASLCIYATCSLEREENDDVVDHALREHPEFERVDLADRVPSAIRPWMDQGVLRLTPDAGSDGFTATGLRRRV